MTVLRWAVVISGLYSAGALVYLILKARSLGQPAAFSRPQGRPSSGVIYALGRGMMPWEKESTRLHFLTYIAGIFYHIGIFVAFAILLAKIFNLKISSPFLEILRLFLTIGLLSGLGLLFKRILKPHARRLSQPDDFGANIFVNVFLAACLAASLRSDLTSFFLAYSIFLFIYIPTGKIRHCFFFFYSRILFGLFFGRRGVLPPRRAMS
jgi:hypothetical protein